MRPIPIMKMRVSSRREKRAKSKKAKKAKAQAKRNKKYEEVLQVDTWV
jgi:CRISPR/Cas system-associated protein Cas10 (large subunit of type III CRISPR-Cas system)